MLITRTIDLELLEKIQNFLSVFQTNSFKSDKMVKFQNIVRFSILWVVALTKELLRITLSLRVFGYVLEFKIDLNSLKQA
ncbi:unnamed protein product [Brugia timori]|uniref:Uncharacterized protein n=1 Tax=Brugia timori TaxID=42155 RepID=A0A0R3QN17_9BILA|nr:unnamed protein product [Brugia timori]